MSLSAQLLRWLALLLLSLWGLHHCQPLQQAFSQNATHAGCHQMSGDSEMDQHHLTNETSK